MLCFFFLDIPYRLFYSYSKFHLKEIAMGMMTCERLFELFDTHADKDVLEWVGHCHDCRTPVTIRAIPQVDGVHIEGGGIYEPEPDRFYLKCDACFHKDHSLKNYQPCEVYSRVVGYLRPVAQWNDAKQEEFRDRKVFDPSLR
jgi:hypothetical protein